LGKGEREEGESGGNYSITIINYQLFMGEKKAVLICFRKTLLLP